MSSFIELNFFYIKIKLIKKFKLNFNKTIEEINSDSFKYNLPENLFMYNKNKAIISLKLYDDFEEYEFLFNVYKGLNQAYIQLDYFFRKVYEIIIYSEINHKIMYLGKELNKLDSLGNKYRKRILLINTEDNLKIDNESLNLYKIVLNNFDNKDSDTEFFQVSALIQRDNNEGRNKKQFIIKKIEEIVDIIQLDIINNKDLLNNFLNDMNITIKKDTFFLSIDNLKRKYKLIFNETFPELNGDNEYINYLCVYNNLTDINQFYIFYLAQFFFKNQIILNNQILLQSIIKRIEEDYKNIDLDKIKIPEKIKIISTFFSIYNDCEEISHLKALKIKYFLFSERQKNSIMDKVYIFFEKFIELLSEESKIFFIYYRLILEPVFARRKEFIHLI